MPHARPSFFPVRLHRVGPKFILELAIAEPLPPGPPRRVVDALTRSGDLALVGGRGFVPLQRLGHVIDDLESVPPVLFIFHVTRCGSTLVGRMLDSDPTNRVFFEPAAVIDLLVADGPGDRELPRSLLRTLVKAYGLGFEAGQHRLVIKLASYCLFHYEKFQEAFPGAASVLLYRDPVEIMVSLVNGPATWMRPDAQEVFCSLASCTPAEMAQMTAEQMAGLFLDLAFHNGLDCAGDFARLVNYTEVPEAAYQLAAGLLGSPLPPDTAHLLSQHSKRPLEPFAPDTERKRRQATASVLAFAEARLYPLYAQLERLRLGALAARPAIAM